AHRYVAEGRCRVYSPEFAHGAGDLAGRVDGFVWAGEGSLVEEGAIVSESVVLPGAVIRSSAVVRDSVIGWGGEVREGAEVTDESIVGEQAVVGEGCEVRGLRVAPGAVLSERAITVRPPA
ncbi:MAG: hypothetical protein ACE5MI_02025, partial [Acidimicrobiia bacterium]